MRIHHLTIGLTLLMFTSLGSYADAKTHHLKCTGSSTFTDGVETRIDTNGDNVSATLSQGIVNCNGSNSFAQEEVEWIPQPTLTDCPNAPDMLELHINEAEGQGQHRAVGTDLKTGDQLFSRFTSATLCANTTTGAFTGKVEGIFTGGTGKNTGATGNFTANFSGGYIQSGFKDNIFGGFGQTTATIEGTLILPDGKD
jgi:hypothetical protein